MSEELWSSSKARRLRSTINPINLHPHSDLSKSFLISLMYTQLSINYIYAFSQCLRLFTFVSSFPARVYIFGVKIFLAFTAP